MNEFLRRDKAAEFLQERYGAYTVETLAKLASVGGGPTFHRFGRFPVYSRADLQDWAQARITGPFSSTAERPARPKKT